MSNRVDIAFHHCISENQKYLFWYLPRDFYTSSVLVAQVYKQDGQWVSMMIASGFPPERVDGGFMITKHKYFKDAKEEARKSIEFLFALEGKKAVFR